jgi:hypothetical protein
MIGAQTPAPGSTIGTLYNTGVDDSGNVLPDLAPDTHWSIVSSPIGPDTTLARDSSGGFPVAPVGPWLGDDSSSRWLIPANTDSAGDAPVGVFDFQTTFSLNGFIPNTAAITGRYSSDNEAIDVLVNGVSTGINNGTAGNDQMQYQFWWNLPTISGLFQSGTNTIDFLVNNDGGPTGFRAELIGSATAVPEPSSLAMGAMGAIGLFVLTRRRAAKA